MTILMPFLLAALMQPGGAPLRQLDKGDQSNVDDARQTVARTPEEYNTLWRLHAPDRPQPKVDFAKEIVVGVFMGSRPTAGFAIEILGTREEAGTLAVQYRETRPARGMITAQVITSAYHIVAISSRPGTVRFERIE
jgi:protease stability complex PrcB-like protein